MTDKAGSSAVLDIALSLSEVGIAAHWLWPKSKKPVLDDWSTVAAHTPESLKASYRPGYNLGIRPGSFSKVGSLYLHVFDIDIRDESKAKEAYDWLDKYWPEWRTFPTVASGSGGSSRHVYAFLNEAFRSRLLARSTEKCDYRGKTPWCWQIELYGTGKQVAAPPSIHPDTGKAYRWLVPLDLGALELGIAPTLDAGTVQSWRSPAAENTQTPPRENRLGLTVEEAKEILAKLPLDAWCEDRDGWFKTGMALNHEFGEEGYEIWCEFSSQSDKFNEKDQRKVWKSFHGGGANPVRMATLKSAARAVEIAEMFDDLPEGGDDDEVADPQSPSEETSTSTAIPSPDAKILAPPAVDWDSKLDLNEEGAVKPTLHNVALIIRNDPRTRGLPQLNQFTLETVQRTMPGRFKQRRRGEAPKGTKQLAGPIWSVSDPVNGDLWSDSRDYAVRDILEAPKTQGGYGIKITDRDMRAAVDMSARDSAFHPVRDYLDGLEWDGRPRADTMFCRYLGTPDNAYTRDVSRTMLLAAVTRVFEPGHKFDFAVILEGFQGKRKSTFISILARHWFRELTADFHDQRQSIENMQGAWILEIPELKQFGAADIRTLKGFISRTTDNARLAYAHRATDFHRQCIFIGSTNDREYLRDDTGGRRFWPIECKVTSIDTDAFTAEVDQIWAETTRRYREMRAAQPRGTLPLYLTGEAAHNEAVALQESRRVESVDDAMAGRIAAWLDRTRVDDNRFDDLDDLIGPRPMTGRNETCLLQLWCECLARDDASYANSPAASQLLGRAMKKLTGWHNIGVRNFEKYGKQRIYRRFGYVPTYGDGS